MIDRTNNRLFTGAISLREDDAEHIFGLLRAEGPPEGPGLVKVRLSPSSVGITEEEDLAILSISEGRALELARQIEKVVHHLEHLRELSRLGQLVPSALDESAVHGDEF